MASIEKHTFLNFRLLSSEVLRMSVKVDFILKTRELINVNWD